MVFRKHVPRCCWCSYTLYIWDLGMRKYKGLISWKLFVAGVWPSTLCVICRGSLLSNSCDPAFIKSRPSQCCLNRKLLPWSSYDLMETVTLAEGSELQRGLFRCVDGSWEYHESEETSRGTRLLFWALFYLLHLPPKPIMCTGDTNTFHKMVLHEWINHAAHLRNAFSFGFKVMPCSHCRGLVLAEHPP